MVDDKVVVCAVFIVNFVVADVDGGVIIVQKNVILTQYLFFTSIKPRTMCKKNHIKLVYHCVISILTTYKIDIITIQNSITSTFEIN